ncbi:MAG: oxidoreductase [Actinobacteria bacterium]|nr:oxidoreductase [Actinomycetota bacterium]
MSDYALFIDYKYCTNCHVCEVTCRTEHNIPLDEWGIKVAEMGPVKLNGKWMWNYVPVPSDLCDFCADRRERGEDPTCVHHCLAQCIEVIPVDQITERMKLAGKTATVFIP